MEENMFKKIILIAFMLITVPMMAMAQGKYDIKSMTPQVKEALEARKDRFVELRSLKSSGLVGENNRGYVEVFREDVNAQSLVALENRDRKVLYQTIAEQNGLEGAIATIEGAFGEVQRQKAEAGDKIQTVEGEWVSK
jgi:uncharacterized protein YdbL (DUF1318 family)